MQYENLNAPSIGSRMQSQDKRSSTCIQADLSQGNMFPQPQTVLESDSNRETTVFSADKESLVEPKEEVDVEDSPMWDGVDANTSTVTKFLTSTTTGKDNGNELAPILGTVNSGCSFAVSPCTMEKESKNSASKFSLVTTTIPPPANTASTSIVSNMSIERKGGAIDFSSSCVQAELAEQSICVKNEPVVKTEAPEECSVHSESILEPMHEVWVKEPPWESEETQSWETEEVVIETDPAVICYQDTTNQDLDVAATSDNSQPAVSSNFTSRASSYIIAERDKKEVNAQEVEIEDPGINERHMRQKCERLDNDSTVDKVVKSGLRDILAFVCEVCMASFACKSNLTRHMKKHTGERPFQCEVCERSFSERSKLTIHKRKHTGERPFQCEICKMSFGHNSSLTTHMRTHTGERPYQCDVCEMSFSQVGHLAVHKRKHTGERPFQCDVCTMSFSCSSSLNTHMRTHTGERRFQCDICKMSFSQVAHLTVHKRKHTGERPFQCDVCKMSFSHVGSLNVHKRKHTGERPFQCEVCQMSFSQVGHLTAHKRKHTGERPFHCNVCAMSFSDRSNLSKHMRTHTGERPYQCDVCKRAFSVKSNLITHMRTHTGRITS